MSLNDYKDAFGIVDKDGLDVRSVSPTRQAAIINWLVTTAHVMVFSSFDDEMIEALWNEHRGYAMVMPVRCYVQ